MAEAPHPNRDSQVAIRYIHARIAMTVNSPNYHHHFDQLRAGRLKRRETDFTGRSVTLSPQLPISRARKSIRSMNPCRYIVVAEASSRY
jgi:hypothetical protein